MAYKPISCFRCKIENCNTDNCYINSSTYKKIYGIVRKSSSERLINIGSQNVIDRECDQSCPPMSWNQSSDRVFKSGTGVYMSMTLGRPGGGATQPKNSGVDIKHNSPKELLKSKGSSIPS